MFMKFENGSYINLNSVLAFGVDRVEEKRSQYGEYIVAAELSNDDVAVVQSHFATKAEAQAALDCLMAATNECLMTGKTCETTSCKKNTVPDLKPFATVQGKKWYKFSEVLKNLVDDYELSGDEDNLLRIDAYIKMYFKACAEKEAKNE